jgi:hypothetical protein
MHYARHLEEISVAALPRGIASEANSDAESNDSLDPEITFPSTAGDPSISNRASAPTTIDPTMVQTIQLRKSQGQSNCHESQLSHLIDGQLPMLFSVTSEDTIESLTWAVKGCLSISDNLDIDLVLEDEEQNPISLDFETITSTTVFYVLLVPKPEHRNIKPAGSLRLGNGTSILNSGLGTSYQVVKDLNERHPEVHSSESGWKFQGNDKPPDRSNFGEFGQSFALGTPASTSQQDIPASIGSHPTSKPHAMCEAQTDENLICCTFVDCNLTFRRPGDYRRHMRTHMGRPYLSAS